MLHVVAKALTATCILGATLLAVGQTQPAMSHAQPNPFQGVAGKTMLIISPHPDDDIVGCGGALAFLSGGHNRAIAVFLTSGERGTLDPSAKPEDIGAIRKREAAAAYKQLGYDAELIWLGYPDGELDFAPLRDVRRQLVHLIRSRRPDILFALDPGATYYRYHYRDHRTAALVSADAVGAAMWPLEYPDLGPAYKVPDVYYFYTAEPNLKVDISEVYDRKLAALAQHRSQYPPAVNHYDTAGPPPARKDLEVAIEPFTGSLTTESFRHR
jgi:LmbE family N-acetylglucosaminyl deacetylase